ncbi:putative methylase [Rhypophila decipiens]|uniref:Methylase n=1 Tax=Rhypophila decipiens TaxID=261697 RepID=A0AAN6Y5M4_9PEZI|nr:putative methylase [Rhypophila decipiens]
MTSPSGLSAEEASPIKVDPDLEREDHVDDGLRSSTASLSSSILNYRKVNGRTYPNFKDAEYCHHMMYLVHDNALHLAPIKDPKMVLDIGTGTGLWATDFADQYPSAQVIGTDLSPIQPSWVPSNCTFQLDDATQPWTFPDSTFDFIHLRFLLGSVPDWPALYAEALRCLKPGGWLEHSDFTIRLCCDDGSVSIGSQDDPSSSCVYTTWNEFFAQAGEKTGRTFMVTDKDAHIDAMKSAGFEEADKIFTRNFKLPLGTWAADKRWKEIGAFNKASCEQGLEGYALYLGTQILGWSEEEMRELFGRMVEAMNRRDWHVYYPCATTWAQKPVS